MYYLKIQIFVSSLHLFVLIEAKSIEADEDNFSSIEDVIMTGDQNYFTAIAIMNSSKESAEHGIKKTIERNNESENLYSDSPYLFIEKNDDQNNYKFQNAGNEKQDRLPLHFFLRRKPWKTFAREASKTCKKACEVAYKEVCSYHDCKRDFKRDMKKQCQSSCKDFFSINSE